MSMMAKVLRNTYSAMGGGQCGPMYTRQPHPWAEMFASNVGLVLFIFFVERNDHSEEYSSSLSTVVASDGCMLLSIVLIDPGG